MSAVYTPSYNNGQELIYQSDDHTQHEGFQSVFIHHHPEIVALGCSFTAGVCIPEYLSWPHIVSRLAGHKVLTIATTGVGLNWLWESYQRYVAEYGLPHTVYLLTPDLKRYKFKSNATFNNPNTHQLNWEQKNETYRDYNNKKPRIRQHNTKIAPIHTGITTYANLATLDNFLHHTKQHNINFTHSTWWHPTHTTLTTLNYPQYTPINTHCDHQPQTTEQHHWWNHSTDGNHGGLHDQIHFAQTFLQTPITNHHLTLI